MKTGTIDWLCRDCSGRSRSTAVSSPPVPTDATPPDSHTLTLPPLSPEPSLNPPVTPTNQVRLVSSLYDSDVESSYSEHTSPMSVNSTSSDGPDIHQLSATGLGTFTDTSIIQESDLENTIPSPATDIIDAPDTPAFHVISGGSAKGSDLLVERNGYRFVKDGKPNRNGQQRWRCSVRTRSVKCLASVMQNGDEFKRGAQSHSCTPKEAAIHTAKIKVHLKEEGKARPFASATTLVKEALQHHLPSDAPTTTLPCMGALIRSTNRHRQIRRPKHPTDLSFEWVEEALPDNFIQMDLRVGAARHVVMFTSFFVKFT